MKRVKKILAGILAATMITTLFIGCSATNNIVATISSEKVSESLYRIYLWSTQQEFESLTPNIWDMELEGKKTEDIAKERALDSIKVSLAAKQKAKELGVELSSDEKSSIKESAKTFIDKNGEVVKTLNVKQKDVEEFFTYGTLIKRVIEKISESYIPNEEELKAEIESSRATYETVTVKHVLIGNKDEGGANLPEDKAKEAKTLAEDILKKALAGEDMAELAKTYSQDPGSKDSGGEYTFTRGKMVPEFEEAAFTGEVGKVYPKLVETSYGYHIIKVETHTMGDEAQIKKDSESRIKQKFAENELTELSGAMKVEKAEAYNNIHIIRNDAKDAENKDSDTEAKDISTETPAQENKQ
ncbi:MAG: hypothetical protein K0S71_1029 [Clostridia bacterium]|nr:hypothetical protein [Clostridia bacterium]